MPKSGLPQGELPCTMKCLTVQGELTINRQVARYAVASSLVKGLFGLRL